MGWKKASGRYRLRPMKIWNGFAPLLAPMLLAATPAPPGVVERATPTVSPGSWFSDADYPAEAVRAQQDGTTEFRLDVDKSGVPTKCTVVTSSGAALLDNATCARLMERARFKPARDASGRPLADSYSGRMMWRLPDPDETRPLPPMPYNMVVTFVVEPDGMVSQCEAILNGTAMPSPNYCTTSLQGNRVTVQRDATGTPVRQKIRMTTRFDKID